jgi:hypothetical protein
MHVKRGRYTNKKASSETEAFRVYSIVAEMGAAALRPHGVGTLVAGYGFGGFFFLGRAVATAMAVTVGMTVAV